MFSFDPDKLSMQDLIKGVQAAGSAYDARVMVQSDADPDKLSEALRAVKGLRSPGFPDKKGDYLITFFMDQKTMYADLVAAAKSVGASLNDPTRKK